MYVPAPRTIYEGIYKLEPGCLLTIKGQPQLDAPAQPLQPGQAYGSLQMLRWWSLADAVEAGAKNPINDEAEALSLLEDLHVVFLQSP
jgi:asparagine synthase (glutamine-hydrolysing)